MKLDAQAADQLEVRPSMESFHFLDSEPGPRARPPRANRRRLNREQLLTKVEELEKFYAAHKLRRARSQLEEVGFVGEVVEFDGDVLLKMVDDLERNMRLSRLEIEKGRSYGKYSAKREAKLREEFGFKGAQKRRKMKLIETKFEENLAQMKAKYKEGSAMRCREQEAVNSLQNNEEDTEEQTLHRQEKSIEDASITDDSTKNIVPKKLSSITSLPIPKPSQKNSNSSGGRTQARNPPPQSIPNFCYLRKENMKPPPTRVNKADAPPQSTKFCTRSNSTTNLDELKDLSSMNSYRNSNLASSRSKLSKEGGHKSKKVLGKAGNASSTPEDPKAFETQSKKDELKDMIECGTYSPDLVQKEDEEIERRWNEDRASIFHLESDSEEPRLSHESGICGDKFEKNEILKFEGRTDDELDAASKNFSASSGSEVESAEASLQLCSPSIRQNADAARVRKKWGIAEKPNIASSNSDNLLKDVAKQFKKLMKFRKKGKIGDNVVNVFAPASSAPSGGDDDTEEAPLPEGRKVVKQSLDDLKKSSNDYLVPAYVGLYEVRSPSYSFYASPANIKLREDPQLEGFTKATCSVFSFLSFHGRGNESRLM